MCPGIPPGVQRDKCGSRQRSGEEILVLIQFPEMFSVCLKMVIFLVYNCVIFFEKL